MDSKLMSRKLPDAEFNLLRYVPNVILDHFIQSSSSNLKPSYPQVHSFKTLLLHTNLLQFSQITQHILASYPNGLEIMVDLHKDYIELLQEYIGPTGGDMLKYTTDRLIFYWPVVNNNADEYLIDLCKVVIDQLIKLSEVLSQRLQYDDIFLNISFVLTIGNISLTTVGSQLSSNQSLQTSIEHIYTGQSVEEALDSCSCELNSTSILVNNAVFDRTRTLFQFEEVALLLTETEGDDRNFENNERTRLFVLRGLKQNLESNASIDPFYFKSEISNDQFDEIKESVFSYVPACVIPYALTATEVWASELRLITSVFINIPINISRLKTQNELSKVQQIVDRMQTICRVYNGFVYRIYIDKTGLNISVIFGLYLQGDSQITARAVLVSTLVVQSLSKINIPAFIGVSTGRVMTAVSGQYRKDFFVIGEPLYMSYLLSLIALKDETKRIFVDYETKKQGESKISFCAYVNPVFTGKISQGVFEPLYGQTLPNRVPGNSFPEVRTHHFNVEHTTHVTKQDHEDSIYMLGRDDQIEDAKQLVLQFLKSPNQINVLLITGKYGVGKSLFLRNLLEGIEEILQDKFSIHNRPSIFASSLDPVKEKRSLNGWRTIMGQVAEELAKRFGFRIEELINKVLELEQHRHGSIRLIEEMIKILGDKPLDENGYEKDLEFITGETREDELDEEDENTLIEVMTGILQHFVGEKSLFRIGSKGERGYEEIQLNKARFSPLILCFDDMQNHDVASWRLFIKVIGSIRKIFIIGAIREEDEVNTERISTRYEYNQQTGIYSNKTFTDVLQRLSNYQLVHSQYLINEERSSLKNNILHQLSKQTVINYNVIELEASQPDVIQELTSRVLGGVYITNEVFGLIMDRSMGNCLTAVDILGSILKQGLLEHVNEKWLPSEELKRFIRLEQFIELIVPNCEYKKTIEQIDALNFIQLNLAKLVSAIGCKFDLKSIVFSNVLNHTILPSSDLLTFLQGLDNEGIVSVLDTENNKSTYQFSSVFVRETLYQLIPVHLRKIQHQNIAICWQNDPKLAPNEYLLYQWALADSEINLYSNRARQITITKRIEEILTQNLTRNDIVLKAGRLQKRSKSNIKWIPRYGVITKLTFKYYKSETDFQQKPVFEKVYILLKDIVKIVSIFICLYNMKSITFLESIDSYISICLYISVIIIFIYNIVKIRREWHKVRLCNINE